MEVHGCAKAASAAHTLSPDHDVARGTWIERCRLWLTISAYHNAGCHAKKRCVYVTAGERQKKLYWSRHEAVRAVMVEVLRNFHRRPNVGLRAAALA